jgi:hypothetical protein
MTNGQIAAKSPQITDRRRYPDHFASEKVNIFSPSWPFPEKRIPLNKNQLITMLGLQLPERSLL